jgi:hypothetical protein
LYTSTTQYMKKISSLFILLTLITSAYAQITTTKLDLNTWYQVTNRLIPQDKSMKLLVQGNPAAIKRLAVQYEGFFKYSHGNISSIEIPARNLITFSNQTQVERIENCWAKGVQLMDTSRIVNNVDSVHGGYAPLTQDYKGRNVIMGVIDGGIYWQHGDFRRADSTTRIRYIWDMDYPAPTNIPLPYNYGNQWTWLDIDNGNCNHVPPSSDFGHGTCVAGIAAGNGNSMNGTAYEGTFNGIAPESEIIAVKVTENGDLLSDVADAVDYIFKKADALGKPCVINTSVGTYYGSRDGKDLTTRMIEYLLDERKGRVLVAAAGNGGNQNYHLSYNIPQAPDSAYTFFKFNSASGNVYFDLWADSANFTNVLFTVGCNTNSGTDLGAISPLNVINDFPLIPDGNAIILTRTLNVNNVYLGTINIQAALTEGRYHIEFLINPGSANNYWRLQTQGSGRFDLWSSSSLIGSADMTSFLAGNVYIQYPEYRHPDSLKTLVSSWQCSDKVITVANYSNRAGYLDRDSNYINLIDSPYYETVGKKFSTSSLGPTRDGRMKPDISASGSTTVCTGDANFIAAATLPQNRLKVSITQKHIRNGGTSMASPVVAGIAALYLEKNPNAGWEEIMKVLKWTAKTDSFTGAVPNTQYGYGKVNGFAALAYTGVIYGSNDTGCINYVLNANVDTGCTAKVYGCTNAAASNYNPAANLDNGSCFAVGINDVNQNNTSVSIVPNPFKGETTFIITGNGISFKQGQISIYNSLGALSDVITLEKNTTQVKYINHKLQAGIYFYTLQLDNNKTAQGKLVIE